MTQGRNKMNPYENFTTDEEATAAGITIDYGQFRVRVALTDESNKAFVKTKSFLFKPLQYKVDSKTITDDEVLEVLQKAFASKGVIAWEVKDENGNFRSGIHLPEGGVGEANYSNILKVFVAQERVFRDLYKQASDYTLFRKVELDEERKNS
jgi:hypothetical protein